MNRPETPTICEQTRERLDSYLEGELSLIEKSALESHVVACAECAAELALARRVAEGLESLPQFDCPPSVTEKVFAHARKHPVAGRLPWWKLMWRPALMGAVAAALVIATGYVGQNGKVAAPHYTRAELEQARAQAKWTLVFINQLSRKTAANVKRDVLDPQVTHRLLRVIDPKQETAPKENVHAS